MEKIEIKDPTKLKITKLTSWKVYFDYDGIHYMIIDDSDEDSHLSLYKRDISNGIVKLTFLRGCITDYDINSLIKDISKKHPKSTVYSNIDREYLVKRLVELGFSSGIFEDVYNKNTEEIKIIREKIGKLYDEIANIQAKWNETSGHGSKCYGIELKAKKAERINGAKDGEWCEQYNDYYGNKHPKYGGKLTDLFNLPVGKSFYVCNGCYHAMISVDEHGDKCILTDCTCVKLTKEHHSLYIR